MTLRQKAGRTRDLSRRSARPYPIRRRIEPLSLSGRGAISVPRFTPPPAPLPPLSSLRSCIREVVLLFRAY